MKPLSEQELREKIVELVHESFGSGYIRGTWAHQNILGDNSREPSNPDDIAEQVLDLILSDRKAWGEYVIGEDEKTYMNGKEVEPYSEVTIDFSGDIHDQTFRDSAQFIETNGKNVLRAEQRRRNQGEKTDE